MTSGTLHKCVLGSSVPLYVPSNPCIIDAIHFLNLAPKNLLHRIGWADNTWEDDSGEDDSWHPEMEMDDGSSSEEEEMMGEDSECSDDSDIDYVPYLCVRYV